MPLKRMLDKSRNFDPKAVAILLEAFGAVVSEFDLRTVTARERAAKLIIRLALGQTDLDAEKLRDSALTLMRNKSATRHNRLPPS